MLLGSQCTASQSDPVRSTFHDVELLEGDIRASLFSFKIPTAIAGTIDQNQAPEEVAPEDCPGLLRDLRMFSHVFKRQRFVGLPPSEKTFRNAGRESMDGYQNQGSDDKEILHDASAIRFADQNRR